VILDSSVAVKWLVPEEHSEIAAALVGQTDIFVPTLFHSEIANALWKKARRGEIRLAEIAPHLAEIPLLVTTLDETDAIPRALAIASELEHPAYDCVYLALAEARDDVVVTADLRFLARVGETAFAVRVRELGK
jgi:predicted nucleic acid-binding protein